MWMPSREHQLKFGLPQGATLDGALQTGYLKAVWLEIFGPVFLGFSAEVDTRDPPRSPGPAPHINFHEKSAPQTKAKWRRTKNPARLASDTQGHFRRATWIPNCKF